jgi:hypothetical protein
MAKSYNYSDLTLNGPSWGRYLKRLSLLVGIPLLVVLVLFLILWNTFFKYVPPGKMLVVISKSGQPLEAGQVLAGPGQKGIQENVLGEGWHFIMPIVYSAEIKDNIVIDSGKVGIVTSKGGTPTAPGRVAEAGEQGILREVLLPGSYRLNPYGYTVKQVPMTRIEPGFVGIMRRRLASNEGEIGIVKGLILQPGIYPVNTEEYEVISCEVGIYQTSYFYPKRAGQREPITFPAKDGNTISLDCTIEWEVQPEHWPAWIAKFGVADVNGAKFGNRDNIERIVIDQHVRKICRDRGFNYGAQDFLEGDKREKFQADFRAELDRVCQEDNVVVRSAFIRNIIIPEKFLAQTREQRLAIETKITNEALTLTAETTAEVAEAKQTIELKVAKVKAETERLVASVERETLTIKEVTDAELERLRDENSAKVAQVEAQRKKVLGEAEAEAKKLKDTAEAALFKLKMAVFGQDGDAYLRYTMAKELNPKMQLRLFHSGPGTLWTNMGNKNLNFLMPLNGGESKSAADKPPEKAQESGNK